jgi:hypothetical protein
MKNIINIKTNHKQAAIIAFCKVCCHNTADTFSSCSRFKETGIAQVLSSLARSFTS